MARKKSFSLRPASTFFAGLLSAVKRAVLLYRGGKLVYGNAAAAQLLGYEADDDLVALVEFGFHLSVGSQQGFRAGIGDFYRDF